MRHRAHSTQRHDADPTPNAERSWEEIEAWARDTSAPRGVQARAFFSPKFLAGIAVAIALILGGIHMAMSMAPGSETITVDPPAASQSPTPVAAQSPQASASPAATPTRQAGEPVVVHVVGQVREPGVITVPAGSRISDAISKAGGLTPNADAAAVNLAREVADGEQIYIPAQGEEPRMPPPGPSPDSMASEGTQKGTESVININTASAEELDELPGVGPAIAGRIVEYREANGPFASVDALTDVKGIGEATLAELRPRVKV